MKRKMFFPIFVLIILSGLISCRTVTETMIEPVSQPTQINLQPLLIMPLTSNYAGSRLLVSNFENSFTRNLGSRFSFPEIGNNNRNQLINQFNNSFNVRDFLEKNRIGDQSRYILFGNIIWLEEYVLVVSIYDTRNYQLISGSVKSIPGIEQNELEWQWQSIERILPEMARELIDTFNKNLSSSNNDRVGVGRLLSTGFADSLSNETANIYTEILSIYISQAGAYDVFPFYQQIREAGRMSRNDIRYFLSLEEIRGPGTRHLEYTMIDQFADVELDIAQRVPLSKNHASLLDPSFILRELKEIPGSLPEIAEDNRRREAIERAQRRAQNEQQRLDNIIAAVNSANNALSSVNFFKVEAEKAMAKTLKIKKSSAAEVEARITRSNANAARHAFSNVQAQVGIVIRIAGEMRSEDGRTRASEEVTKAQAALTNARQLLAAADESAAKAEAHVKKRKEKEINIEKILVDEGRRLWTIGTNFGTSFASPRVIFNGNATIAPLSFKNTGIFLECGYDYGIFHGRASSFGSGRTDDKKIGDVDYFSSYYYGRLNWFFPFKKMGGWYIGAGAGMMDSYFEYTDPSLSIDVVHVENIAFDFTSGFFIGKDGLFRIGYAGRIAKGDNVNNFSINHRLIGGVSYRFGKIN